MSRGILFTIAGTIAFLIFGVVFVGISVFWNEIYYAIEPTIRFGPLGFIPGPTGEIFRGVEDLIEMIIYVVLALGAVLALALLVAELVAGWPFKNGGREQNPAAG